MENEKRIGIIPGQNKAVRICWIGLNCIFFLLAQVKAQPFLDLFQVRYTYGFRNTPAKATSFSHLLMGSDLAFKLKAETYLLISPTYEQWRLDSVDEEEIFPVIHSLSLPVGLILPIAKSKWGCNLIAIPRFNGEELFKENTFQFGGAALVVYERRPGQKFRLGAYVNDEFFGLFVIPLLGVDWRINEKNYLFGNLPGRLTYEHEWSAHFYGGLTFRAPTNSYRLSNGQYLRVDDNQLSLYLDYYPAKNICLTIEPGYGLFRQLRTGTHSRDYIREADWGDGLFIKINAAYRVRFDK